MAAQRRASGATVWVSLAVVGLVTLVLAVAVAGALTAAGSGGDYAGETTAQPDGVSTFGADIDADAVELLVALREDGDADWAVRYRLELDTEERQEAFEELREAIDAEPETYLDPFEARIQETTAAASETTGREMGVSNFTVEADRESQPQASFGVVTFRFEWAGFATDDDGTLVAGDALDRLVLDEGERLQFGWPDGYGLTAHTPEPDTVDQTRVVWRGPLTFDDGQPRVELAAEESGIATIRNVSLGLGLAVGGVLVVVLVAWRRQRGIGTEPVGDERSGEAGTGSDGDVGSGSDGDGESRSIEEGPPPELLRNEERVVWLLEANGGRMKQADVADELDWTAAKTSQVVADLREQEAVESFRLGRENVLTLPDVDILAGDDDTDGSESAAEPTDAERGDTDE